MENLDGGTVSNVYAVGLCSYTNNSALNNIWCGDISASATANNCFVDQEAYSEDNLQNSGIGTALATLRNIQQI